MAHKLLVGLAWLATARFISALPAPSDLHNPRGPLTEIDTGTSHNQSEPWTRSEMERDMDYKAVFPGIHWDNAETTCEDWELAILVEATRMTDEMINKFERRAWWWDSPAFNRYFLRDYLTNPTYGWHGDEQSQNTMWQISNNIRQAAAFPKTGRRNKAGQQGRRQKLGYQCRAPLPPATPSKCQWDDPQPGQRWTGPSAETYRPLQNDNVGWLVVFCPRFFKDGQLSYINDITKTPKSESQLPSLRSYEYAIAHEWMHASLFGYAEPIVDLQANLPGTGNVDIYGDDFCHRYAWINYDSYRGVNLAVAANADNYAWMFQYNWFIDAFGWQSDGSQKRSLPSRDTSQESDDPLDNQDPVVVDENWIPPQATSMPINCNNGDSTWTDEVDCAYVGEEYPQFLEDIKTGFKSLWGCDLSAECNLPDGYAIDPSCTCSCDGQPAAIADPRCVGFEGALPEPPS